MHPGSIHVLPCPGPLRASVVLLHGYASRAAVHLGEAEAFVSRHVEVVLPDAPGHGVRDDGRLARIGALAEAERPAAIVAIAREWCGELPALAAACRARGAHHVGLVGISMGGFAALGALATPTAVDAVAALLAAPLLADPARLRRPLPPLLLGLAGRDQAVPPEPGRAFARAHGAELHEYPASEHVMRGEDWRDLWARTAAFLQRHLAAG
ncbi:MAG: alpha/beta fold hydrolase [Planctomycetes bacterium]|nr:alpha/beta fold hydrolase [Planctomycetota bacterium]